MAHYNMIPSKMCELVNGAENPDFSAVLSLCGGAGCYVLFTINPPKNDADSPLLVTTDTTTTTPAGEGVERMWTDKDHDAFMKWLDMLAQGAGMLGLSRSVRCGWCFVGSKLSHRLSKDAFENLDILFVSNDDPESTVDPLPPPPPKVVASTCEVCRMPPTAIMNFLVSSPDGTPVLEDWVAPENKRPSVAWHGGCAATPQMADLLTGLPVDTECVPRTAGDGSDTWTEWIHAKVVIIDPDSDCSQWVGEALHSNCTAVVLSDEDTSAQKRKNRLRVWPFVHNLPTISPDNLRVACRESDNALQLEERVLAAATRPTPFGPDTGEQQELGVAAFSASGVLEYAARSVVARGKVV